MESSSVDTIFFEQIGFNVSTWTICAKGAFKVKVSKALACRFKPSKVKQVD